MTTTTRTFTTTAAPDVVLEYLTDFGHAVEWDPGTQSCVRNDSGPIVVGSSWHNTSRILGATTELTYTLRERTADHVTLVGENDSATATDTIHVTPDGGGSGGSQVTYQAELEMHGAAKLATPVLKLEFEKLGNEVVERLGRVLDDLA